MSIFWRPQRSVNGFVQSNTVDGGGNPERNGAGFMVALENNAREILLFSASLILLLFNMLERTSRR